MVSTGRQGCVMMATLEWILVNARRLVCVRATCKQARRSVSPTSVFSLFFFLLLLWYTAPPDWPSETVALICFYALLEDA